MNQSSIMTEDEQAKYNKLADQQQEADSSAQNALADIDNNPMLSATKQISQMSVTSQDLKIAESDPQPVKAAEAPVTKQLVINVNTQPSKKSVPKAAVSVPEFQSQDIYGSIA